MALVDQWFLQEKQHAGTAGTDVHVCKNSGERDTKNVHAKFLSRSLFFYNVLASVCLCYTNIGFFILGFPGEEDCVGQTPFLCLLSHRGYRC